MSRGGEPAAGASSTSASSTTIDMRMTRPWAVENGSTIPHPRSRHHQAFADGRVGLHAPTGSERQFQLRVDGVDLLAEQGLDPLQRGLVVGVETQHHNRGGVECAHLDPAYVPHRAYADND